MKKLLILTGPQGSGNHLWTKIFSDNENVKGWNRILNDYWASHRSEPFTKIWKMPELFDRGKWEDGLYVTSRSVPFGIDKQWSNPDFDTFMTKAKENGFIVKIGIIGRDQNILKCQQERVKYNTTYHQMLNAYDDMLYKYDPIFLSTELLYLYKRRYLNQVSQLLDFPVNISDDKLNFLLDDDCNKKYVVPIKKHWLDRYRQLVSRDKEVWDELHVQVREPPARPLYTYYTPPDEDYTEADKYLAEYFTNSTDPSKEGYWRPPYLDNKNEGIPSEYDTIVSKISDTDLVLDVGCGYNPFKGRIKNLTAIDKYNTNADKVIDMLDYNAPDASFDVVIALGSTNLHSFRLIDKQITKIVNWTKPGGRIFMRVNPGIDTTTSPKYNLCKWTIPDIEYFTDKFNLIMLEPAVLTSSDRYIFTWQKQK